MEMLGVNSTSVAGRDIGRGPTPPRRRRVLAFVRIFLFSAFGVTALLAGGFGLFATHISRLAAPDDPPKADAIIVLTGGQSRLDVAVGLLKSGKGERLLISGVHPAADRDDLRAATGGSRRLFSCCVDIDHEALDTVGNAEESAKWMVDHAYDRVILVTNNYHMPRSLLEMSRLVGTADLVPYPVVNTRLDAGGWMTKPEALRVLFTEYTKYVAALARGVVSAPPRGTGLAKATSEIRQAKLSPGPCVGGLPIPDCRRVQQIERR